MNLRQMSSRESPMTSFDPDTCSTGIRIRVCHKKERETEREKERKKENKRNAISEGA